MRGWLLVVLGVGCGRVAFDPRSDGGGGAAIDAPRFALDAGECPPGYSFMLGRCYRVVSAASDIQPWLAAEADCEDDAVGAHLVVVDDITEAMTVDSLVPGAILDHWIGVTDVVTQDSYVTVTNMPPGYLVWDPAEPDGALGEDCLLMDDARALHDGDCMSPDDYVCEYDGIAAVPAAYGQ